MGSVDPICRLVCALPFVVETVVGPYLCRWGWIDGRPATVFIAPYDGEAAPADVIHDSPRTMPPMAEEARA